jgi:hypothetical protein
MTVLCHNRMGSILYCKKKAMRCNGGDEILPYMLRLIFEFFFMDRPYVYFYFYFLKLKEKCPNT